MKIKNPIVRHALSGAIKALIGSAMWEKVLAVVASLGDSGLNGEEKRAMAIQALKNIGWGLGQWTMNLAIEIAVAWLDNEAQKLSSDL